MQQRLVGAIVTVLVVAVGIRIGAEIIQPVLPGFTIILGVALVVLVILGGPRAPK